MLLMLQRSKAETWTVIMLALDDATLNGDKSVAWWWSPQLSSPPTPGLADLSISANHSGAAPQQIQSKHTPALCFVQQQCSFSQRFYSSNTGILYFPSTSTMLLRRAGLTRSPHLLLDPWQLGGHSRISGGKHLHLLPRFSPGIHPRVVSLGTSDTPTDNSSKQSWELKKIEKDYLFARSFDQEWPHHLLRK